MEAASLWAGVVAVGAFHGLNPAMGWPLAVAQGLGEKRGGAVLATFVPLGVGHLLAMAVVLLPFTLLAWFALWAQPIRIGAALLVIGFGVSRLFVRRHPRWLARIRPSQLLLWSFLMATAHGAALMLLPILMGLCQSPADPHVAAQAAAWGHDALMRLMRTNLGTAIAVSLLHSVAMVGAGLAVAWLVYRHLGLRVLRSAWLDLDRVWAVGLIVSGAAALLMAGSPGVMG